MSDLMAFSITSQEEIPRQGDDLTAADFMNPQLGDQFMQGSQHARDVQKVLGILRYVHRDKPHVALFTDVKLLLRRRGGPNPAPDVMIIPDVDDPSRPRHSFDVQAEGTRPTFILEVVSPNYRRSDREDKVDVYEQAGTMEYFLIDANLKPEGTLNYEIVAYRLVRGEYRPILPDEQGRFYSQVNHVWFMVTEDEQGFLVLDGDSGDPILPDDERAENAAERAQQAEARARIAEERAEYEAAARADMERRLAELEAELARLQGKK